MQWKLRIVYSFITTCLIVSFTTLIIIFSNYIIRSDADISHQSTSATTTAAYNSSSSSTTHNSTQATADYYHKPASHELAKAQLGHSTWTFLHNLAAKYPETPTKEDKDEYFTFMIFFAKRYPCDECAMEFRRILEKEKINLESRAEFEDWLCTVHNMVNQRLRKAPFDCTRLSDRWDCGCDL